MLRLKGLKIGLRKRAARMWSSMRMMLTKTEKHPTATAEPSPHQLPSWSYYTSIDELPLTHFIACAVHADFNKLVKYGDVPGHLLNSAWLHIHSDYCERIGGVHISSLINKSKSLNALASKIDRIRCLVAAAGLHRSEKLAAALKDEGYKLDISADEEAYQQQLRVVLAKLRPETMRLDRMINDMPKDSDKKTETERDFTNTLMECCKFEGYRIKASDLTTGEYCEHVRRLREYIDAQMKAAKRAS